MAVRSRDEVKSSERWVSDAQPQFAHLASAKLPAIPADLPSSLTHLDLSFNAITHIETASLSGLCQLTSLSLYSNRISHLKLLPALPSLAHISLGNNEISNMAEVASLRRLRGLRSLTLVGNPICTPASYRGAVLAQLRRLQFLDHARVTPAELRTALELHQDEVLKVKAEEEAEAAAEKTAADAAERAAALHGANLTALAQLPQDLGDPTKQPAWARLQRELPQAVAAWATDNEQMVAATNAFLAASLQYHSQQQAAVKQYDTAAATAAHAADLASWAAVDRWQDGQRRQHNTDSSRAAPAAAAEDEQRLCTVQLCIISHPTDEDQLVQLVLTLPNHGASVDDGAAAWSGGSVATAAPLRLHLTRTKEEAAAEIDSAVQQLAEAVSRTAVKQSKLLEEHREKMQQLEGVYDAACRDAAALLQEKRSATRHRGASGTRRSSNIAVHRSSMAQQDPTQQLGHHDLLQLADASHDAHVSSIQGAIAACRDAQGQTHATLAGEKRKEAATRHAARLQEIASIC